MIRQGIKADSKEAAILLYETLEGIAVKLTGGTTDEEVLATLEDFFQQEVNRLNYTNAFVKVIDNKLAGIMIAYHGKDAEAIDAPIIEHLRTLKNDATITIDKEAEEDAYYIDTLSVNAEFRGQGIGTDLMKAAEDYAKEQGYDKISLNVEYDNERAHNLYTKVGFKEEKTITIIGKKFYYMVKELA
ncbi:GNAT family N-acetyltransferase [Priestia taiwanensis]|uniref:Acetyltransferase n=1 Tax=Priestia taiwanensis TaxID=1347902 RepID=A0A917ERI4_9BACI|nr:GNAT family N-acetyltransferase [Priestia taiwanensis]MBM7363974.1 ribosomal protein S18 acetylase RimI-like enzyme [Priestia taiwanensis]GGE70640.1 acetyltransferase [Priestia taiwanensis]